MFKYFRRSGPERILLLQILVLLGFVRLALLILPFGYLSGFLGEPMQESTRTENAEIAFRRQLSWAIELISRYTPWQSKCLVQAITGKLVLRRKRLENTLYLGVAKTNEDSLIAHAWLRSGQEIVTGACGSNEFTVVAKFADCYGDLII